MQFIYNIATEMMVRHIRPYSTNSNEWGKIRVAEILVGEFAKMSLEFFVWPEFHLVIQSCLEVTICLLLKGLLHRL